MRGGKKGDVKEKGKTVRLKEERSGKIHTYTKETKKRKLKREREHMEEIIKKMKNIKNGKCGEKQRTSEEKQSES